MRVRTDTSARRICMAPMAGDSCQRHGCAQTHNGTPLITHMHGYEEGDAWPERGLPAARHIEPGARSPGRHVPRHSGASLESVTVPGWCKSQGRSSIAAMYARGGWGGAAPSAGGRVREVPRRV